MVLPAFVECHTHIDKGHIWPRTPNPDGTFMSALESVGRDRVARWSAEDVRRRMEFSLRCAYVHGTAALRTHIDSIPPQEAISWPVFEEMRERWNGAHRAAGRLPDHHRAGARARLVVGSRRSGRRRARRDGRRDLHAARPRRLLDEVVRAAADRGLDLDFHADETADPEAVALDRIAEAVIRNRFEGRVLVGHCCSLARQVDDVARRTLDKVAKAGISVVSLPMCNLYLQDRRTDGTTPRWRGVTLLHEMKARGIKVAIASDNTRDPFYAYGDLDMLEVLRLGTRILHLDHPFADWPAAVAASPAEIMGLENFGGSAWRHSGLHRLQRPLLERASVAAGIGSHGCPQRSDNRCELPDYSELDDLMVA